MSRAAPAFPVPPVPAQVRRNRAFSAAAAVLSVVLLVVVLVTLDLPAWERVRTGLERTLPPLWRGFTHPDRELFPLALGAMLETFYMAVLGTLLGGILAFALSFLAARNLLGGTGRAMPGKALLVAIRTFPEILLAIIFVAAAGPGPTAGIMAMGIHSIGFLGKIFSDVIEGIDPGPMEAIRAAGGNGLHVFLYAVVPQVLPEFASNVLYRFEINLRAATILGLVGAGGIGGPLIQRLQFRRWDEISMILIVIVSFIVVVDFVSSTVRRRLV
ncbi:MAG TPA: phosphonate ABC transporter, permease protein PhnE [Trueperaceae bacterium]|jgi:phosphonate transport system permease protein|nr:phosphonate ABC transporter, permease protein PhnE [Trueperaceae bacterium]